MDVVRTTVESGMCIGCGACTLLAGEASLGMTVSGDGFLVPNQLPNAGMTFDRRAFMQVCPARSLDGPGDDRKTVLWGPVHGCYAGHAADDALRFSASSGGALTAALRYLLASGAVDCVVTMGNSMEDPLKPRVTVARVAADLDGTEGSRYCPSSPLTGLKETEPHDRVAFVGKPCDVATLRQLSRLGNPLARRVTVAVSFFCAGIPSYQGTDALLAVMGASGERVGSFRYRGNGWPGRATASTEAGEFSRSYHESWAEVLTHFRHDRCKVCPDGTGETADLVFADAWHSNASGPIFDEAPGRSLVIARNELGMQLLQEIRNAGHIIAEPFDPDRIEEIQPYQAARKRAIAPRLAGWLLGGSRVPQYKGFGLFRAARDAGPAANYREFRGALARSVRRRRTSTDEA